MNEIKLQFFPFFFCVIFVVIDINVLLNLQKEFDRFSSLYILWNSLNDIEVICTLEVWENLLRKSPESGTFEGRIF